MVTEVQTQVDRKCKTTAKMIDQLKLKFPLELKKVGLCVVSYTHVPMFNGSKRVSFQLASWLVIVRLHYHKI